jgi:hypothetical protein
LSWPAICASPDLELQASALAHQNELASRAALLTLEHHHVTTEHTASIFSVEQQTMRKNEAAGIPTGK